jgi:hypothetical protein
MAEMSSEILTLSPTTRLRLPTASPMVCGGIWSATPVPDSCGAQCGATGGTRPAAIEIREQFLRFRPMPSWPRGSSNGTASGIAEPCSGIHGVWSVNSASGMAGDRAAPNARSNPRCQQSVFLGVAGFRTKGSSISATGSSGGA